MHGQPHIKFLVGICKRNHTSRKARVTITFHLTSHIPLFLICFYWFQPVLYHLDIPRVIYRDVYSELFTEMFTVYPILPLTHWVPISVWSVLRSVKEFDFLGHLLEVLGRYVWGSLLCWRCLCGIARSERDGTCAETRFGLSAQRTSPFKLAGGSVQSTAGSRGVRISGSNGSNGSNAGYTTLWGRVQDYWLPTPLACFPFTSSTLRHRVPSGIKPLGGGIWELMGGL